MDNMTGVYSPLHLDDGWPRFARLFFLMLLAGTGTITNGFFIAMFFTAPELMKKGHTYLACVGLSDLIITGMVVPSLIGVLASRMNETTRMCQILQLLTQWSTYAYSLFFMLVSIDMYTRLVRGYTRYTACMTYPICIAVVTFATTLATAAVGVFFELDYDYCHREHKGNFWFRIIMSMTFYVIPSFITIILLLKTSVVSKDKGPGHIRYKRCHLFEKNLINLHLGCYCFFVGAWLPYLTVVNLFPDTDDVKYYALIWIGLIRSEMASFVYSALNELFRRVFQYLCVYCCYQEHTTLPNSRQMQNDEGNGTVKAHNIVVSKSNSSAGRNPPLFYTL